MSMQPGEMFQVNLSAVENMRNAPACLKLAIVKAKNAGYYSLEEFLREISDSDLVMLQVLFEKAMQHDEESLNSAILISVTLAQTEGVLMEQDSSVKDFFTTMFIGLNLESLSRKGILTIQRQNLSFLNTDESVAILTDFGRQIAEKMKGQDNV